MNKFKIGDKVRVINNDQRYSEDFTGQESEVIDSGPNWYEIKVQYKDGGYNFLTFNENELEKVVEQFLTIPVGAIVKITINSEVGDKKLYVNYGIVRKYNEEEHPYIYEHYEVAVIFNMDQEFDEYPYYPQQLEVVYPEKVAPNLWGSVADKLTDSEKINLVHEIFHNPRFENDITISGSFLWSISKKGVKYWEEINDRITMNELEPGAAFKVGDRVRFDCPDLEVDYGTIVERHTENSWWIDWDSDGYRCHCEEKYMALVDSEEQPEETSSKTKSDGGSSDYYKLEINGNPVEVEDVIYAMVGGDFALGNALKALRRMYLDSKGQGKEGIDMQYDANKIKYFVDSYVKRFGVNNG